MGPDEQLFGVTAVVSEINERIDVLASFQRKGLQPRLFVWEKRRYPVAKVTATWTEPEGLFRHHFFAVLTDGANLYELCFCTRDLDWRLMRIHHD